MGHRRAGSFLGLRNLVPTNANPFTLRTEQTALTTDTQRGNLAATFERVFFEGEKSLYLAYIYVYIICACVVAESGERTHNHNHRADLIPRPSTRCGLYCTLHASVCGRAGRGRRIRGARLSLKHAGTAHQLPISHYFAGLRVR